MNSLTDPGVAELLERLHRDADVQAPELRKRVAGIGKNEQSPEACSQELRDFYLPVSREHGQLLYQTVRAVRPERVVEFGSSFGVSAIYLAAGLRDNGRGIVVGSELIEQKAATARRNLSAAGLDDFADVRTGDARLTLNHPGFVSSSITLKGRTEYSVWVDTTNGRVRES